MGFEEGISVISTVWGAGLPLRTLIGLSFLTRFFAWVEKGHIILNNCRRKAGKIAKYRQVCFKSSGLSVESK